jgi:hypothetical protein
MAAGDKPRLIEAANHRFSVSFAAVYNLRRADGGGALK